MLTAAQPQPLQPPHMYSWGVPLHANIVPPSTNQYCPILTQYHQVSTSTNLYCFCLGTTDSCTVYPGSCFLRFSVSVSKKLFSKREFHICNHVTTIKKLLFNTDCGEVFPPFEKLETSQVHKMRRTPLFNENKQENHF